MKIQLIRHATMLIEINGKKLLLDPMFSPAGLMEAIPDVPNKNNNPLVDLPIKIASLIDVDAVLITHTHRDHFDSTAIDVLPKDTTLFCQPDDAEKIKGYGFINTKSIEYSYEWKGIKIYLTKGQHGRGEVANRMGPVSGFVLYSKNEPSLYIVGDSIWCDEVKQALDKYQPQITICFAGAAQFSNGGPITMTKEDICNLAEIAPYTKIIVAHMESWNHCLLSHKELKTHLRKKAIPTPIYIPENGETISLN